MMFELLVIAVRLLVILYVCGFFVSMLAFMIKTQGAAQGPLDALAWFLFCFLLAVPWIISVPFVIYTERRRSRQIREE